MKSNTFLSTSEDLLDKNKNNYSESLYVFSRNSVLTVAWSSSLLFALYILAFYVGSTIKGHPERWNQILPGLHNPNNITASNGLMLHMLAGALILLMGCIQFISLIRNKFPAFHRTIGKVYVLSSILAAVGGLSYILLQGTIGGFMMNVGFGVYGLLTLFAGIKTFYYARLKKIDKHWDWALRLFALGIASWLYRMYYGFWIILAGRLWRTPDFQGPFDMIMDFFFYIPNLIIIEFYIRYKDKSIHPVLKTIVSILFLITSIFFSIGTYYFTKYYWGPAILEYLNN